MKKIISIIIAIMMSVSVITANAVPCFAVYINSIEEADEDLLIKVTVNGTNSIHGEYKELIDEDIEAGYKAVVDFKYTGGKTIRYWEVKDLVEGEDYIIIENNGTGIRVALINPDVKEIWANVVTTDPESQTIKNPDKSHVSPNTGAAALGASAALAGAGIALLSVAKRRK